MKFGLFDVIPCSSADKIVSEEPTAFVFSIQEFCCFEDGKSSFLEIQALIYQGTCVTSQETVI
jgi:hypothetical protein